MERYTRILLLWLYALVRGLEQQVEGFLFGTRLTRVTRFQKLDGNIVGRLKFFDDILAYGKGVVGHNCQRAWASRRLSRWSSRRTTTGRGCRRGRWSVAGSQQPG